MALKKLPTEAQWFPYPGEPSVRVAIYHQKHPAFQELERQAQRRRARENSGRFAFMGAEDALDSITAEELVGMDIDKACNLVVDWEGVAIEGPDGTEVAVAYADRRTVLEDPGYADFRDWIIDVSESYAAHKERRRKAISGNSNGALSGNTAGAPIQS